MSRRQLDIRTEVWIRERNLEAIVIYIRIEAMIVAESIGREFRMEGSPLRSASL